MKRMKDWLVPRAPNTEIAEGNQAAPALRASEEQLRAIVESTDALLVNVDQSGRFTYVNEAAARFLGYSPQEMVGRLYLRYVHREDRGWVSKTYLEQSQTGKPTPALEFRLVTSKGQTRWVRFVANPMLAEGRVTSILGVALDITERKRTEAEVQRLARFPSENPNPVLRVAADGTIVYANKASAPLLDAWMCQVGERLPECWCGVIQQVLDSEETQYGEVEYADRVLSLTFASAIDADYAILYGLDITQRRRAEEEHRKLSQAVEQSPSTVLITDPQSSIEYVNPKFTELTGYSMEEIVGQTPNVLKSGKQSDEFYRVLWRTILAGEEWRGEFANRKKSGELYWELASISPVRNAEGKVTHFVKVAENITARKQAEEALRRERDLVARIAETSPAGITVVNREGQITFANGQAEKVLGLSKDKITARTYNAPEWRITDYSGGPFPDEDLPFRRVMATGRSVFDVRHAIEWPDGRRVLLSVNAAPILDQTGQLDGMVATVEDITQRIQAEDALRRYTAELEVRNQELDAFAHTVAHDLQNPLGLVIGFAEILESSSVTVSQHEMEEYLSIIAQNGRKMANIIDELMILAGVRQMDVEMMPLNMSEIVLETQMRLADMIEEHAVEILMPDDWPVVLGHGPWVEEVWANYLSNAIRYGGHPPQVQLGADELPDGMVRFWIKDNGPGLTPEQQSQLFVPFTQLAQVRTRGHGLGLSIVHRIVEKLGGQVAVESEGIAGQGSLFSFTLPGAPDA